MNTRPWITLAMALIAVAALAGCSEESAGSPMPDTTVTTGTDPDTTEPTTSTETGSARPREITLDGEDPCTLIPQSELPQFGIEGPGRPEENPNFKAPGCLYSGVGHLALVVTEGVDAWEERTQTTEISEAEPIEGFPTITIWNEADMRSCYAVVDVADGQYLLTAAAPNPDDPDEPEACDLAYRMAESAMKTLVAS